MTNLRTVIAAAVTLVLPRTVDSAISSLNKSIAKLERVEKSQREKALALYAAADTAQQDAMRAARVTNSLRKITS
jgi:prefoldin subunit 5